MAKKAYGMAEYQNQLEKFVEQYNKRVNANNNNMRTFKSLCDDTDELIAKMNGLSRVQHFDKLVAKNAANPLLAACLMPAYEVVKVKDDEDKDTGVITRHIEHTWRPVDLRDLHKTLKDGIGADKSWIYEVEHLNLLMTARLIASLNKANESECKRTGKTFEQITLESISDSYKMSKISREIKAGSNPTSNNKTLAEFQKCVNMMIGEQYKVRTQDLRYIESCYAKRGKSTDKRSLKVIASTHKALTDLLFDVCIAVMTDGYYSVDYKRVKEKAAKTAETEQVKAPEKPAKKPADKKVAAKTAAKAPAKALAKTHAKATTKAKSVA